MNCDMGYDKTKLKQICWMILYVGVVILLLIHSNILFSGIRFVVGIFVPFIIGGAIAFILNIPMNGIEKKLLGKWNGRLADKLKRPVSMILSIIFVVAIITLVIVAIVPQLRNTITTLGTKVTPFLQDSLVWLQGLATDYPELKSVLQELDSMEFNWDSILANVVGFLKNGVGSMVGSTFTVASSIIGGVANIFIAVVFAIYLLSQKEELQRQACRIIDAYASKKVNKSIREVCQRLYVNFTKFICGQCLEAVILGVAFVVFMSIFRMPYAIMIGTLIAFTALIPIVGAFIGCGVGAFMILIDNPIQALWFVILFLIIQQLEGNLIYPKVVGNSVGLPSIWVLMSVSVGGSLFGVVGMLVFIPLMSTLYSLLRDDVNRRNAQRNENSRSRDNRNIRQNRERRQSPTIQTPTQEATPAEIVERLVIEQEARVQEELRAQEGAEQSNPAQQRREQRERTNRRRNNRNNNRRRSNNNTSENREN